MALQRCRRSSHGKHPPACDGLTECRAGKANLDHFAQGKLLQKVPHLLGKGKAPLLRLPSAFVSHNMAEGQGTTFELYRGTVIGDCLVEALEELNEQGKLTEDMVRARSLASAGSTLLPLCGFVASSVLPWRHCDLCMLLHSCRRWQY